MAGEGRVRSTGVRGLVRKMLDPQDLSKILHPPHPNPLPPMLRMGGEGEDGEQDSRNNTIIDKNHEGNL